MINNGQSLPWNFLPVARAPPGDFGGDGRGRHGMAVAAEPLMLSALGMEICGNQTRASILSPFSSLVELLLMGLLHIQICLQC